MIKGIVAPTVEAFLPVTVLSYRGDYQEFNFLVDTGFSGLLSLPASEIQRLDLGFVESRSFWLADDSLVEFDLFEAIILWDGEERDVSILASDSPAAIGMELLHGYKICIDVVDGGEVVVESR